MVTRNNMKRVIKLTESDLIKIIENVINEDAQIEPEMVDVPLNRVQSVQKALVGNGYNIGPTGIDGKFGRNTRMAVIKFQKDNGIKQTGNVGPITAKRLGVQPLTSPTSNSINKSTSVKTQSTGSCQVITPKTDIKDLNQIVSFWKKQYPNNETYSLINRVLNRHAESFKSQGIPPRTACEIALIKIRPGYKDKNAFIIDTLNKILYLYNAKGEFIAKTQIISGKNKQSTDPKVIAKSLLTWSEQAKKLGFEWVNGKGYVDKSGKNRKYDPEIIYADTDKSKTRFLPKGIYTTAGSLESNAEYAGKTQNLLSLVDSNKELAQAIHGYYIEQPRIEALRKAQQVLSNPNDKKVSQEFMDLVSNKKVNLSQSYGCINLPENFIPYLRKYGPNSYVFNMGEDLQNYLVSNTENYFDKMQNSESCPSPQSLGAVEVSAVA